MVVNRGDIKRKRKDDACINLLDESPKRTKVHAQRKFAQGSNVSSPVITPVKEIERQDRNKDILPEPTELLPIKRPNTEDFLTFLCFRGTPILPPNLNFFNTASMINTQIQTDEPKNMSPKNGPIVTTAIKKSINERPFIAFGVRKRADPIIISKQMDKKRRHALTLQALRRKYQEQKMAKIRAVTISKLSEKITSKSVVRTRSVTKNETVTKKSITQKTKVKVVATKRVTIKQPIRTNIKSKMCLRSFRGRYIHHELSVRSHKKKQIPKSYVQHKRVTKKIAKKAEATSSEFSSDDDEPLVKAAKVKSNKNNPSKIAKKSASGLKKATEVNYRLTRSNNRVLSNQLSPRKQAMKRKRFFTKTSSNIRSASSKIKRKIIKSPRIKRNKDKKQVTETLTPVKKEVVEKKMTRAIKKGEKSSANNQITEHILRSSEAKKIGKMDQEKVKKLESKISKTEQKHKLRLKNDEVSKQANVEEKKKVSKEKITKVNEMHITKKEEHIKPIEKIVETEIHIGRKEEHKKIEKPKQEKMLQESVKVEKEHPMENAKKAKPEFEKAIKVIKSDDPKDKILEKKSTESINKIAERKSDEPKSNKTTERKFDEAKNKAVERKSAESNLSTSRPSRKTKEAAAIYMEILGHKLVNDTEIDDDNVSIDSFPELPNVRKTEQRENELKAKAKSKSYKTIIKITKKQSAIEQVQIEKQGHEKILPERATDILEQIIGITMQKNKDKVAENLKSKESSIDEKKINKTLLDEKKPNESLLDEKKINKIVLDDKKIDKMALDEKKTNKATRDEKKTNKLSIDEKNTNKTVIEEAKTKEVFVDETKVNPAQTDEKEMCKPALVKKSISKTPLDEKQEISSKRKPNQNDKLDVNSEADVNLYKSKVPRKTEELCTVHDAYNVSKLDNRERRQTRNLGSKQVLSFSDSNESFGLADASENMSLKKINISNILEIKPNICLSDIKNELTKPTFNLNTSDTKEKPVDLMIKDCSSVEVDKPYSLKKNERLKKKTKTQRLKIDAEPDFSDSDEEPLAKLTKSKAKVILEADAKCKPIKSNNKKLENKPEILKFQNKGKLTKEKVDEKMFTEKPKRECTKKPQNYMPLFSSSDDEEKYFHGFVKTEPKTLKEKNDDEKCVHSLASSDLLCKDISRRFGKGKVNMSNEQIEKWLNDSAMAGINIKKENDEMLKFGEKIPSEISLYSSKLKTVNTDENIVKDVIIKTKDAEETCSTSFNSTPEKQIVDKPSIKPILNERKTIFRKEKSAPKRNINAFSVSNESSVYAFEADNEDSVNTPFRRPSRRPSSTTTSKSEDEVSKMDDVTKNSGKFRLPALIKTDLKSPNKNETPVISEQSTISNSNTDQVNLECTDTQNQTIDNDRILYIPLQSSKQSLRGVMGCEKKTRSTENSGAKPKSTIPCMQKLDEKPLSMFPPAHALQKSKNDNKTHKSAACKAIDRLSETSDDYKYKVPNSPSASSSSSAKLYNKRVNAKTRNRTLELCTSVNVAEFPNSHTFAQMVDAPVFHPTEKEFQDPIEYIEKIRAKAERFGICRIVPPSTFKPECKVSDDMRFTAYNQYVHKMLHRWGPNFKELMAIKKYLQTQNITLTHPPWIGGMEIDLPRLYQTVQSLGGLKEVIEKKKWPKVSEAMKIPKSAQDRVTKLDDIYCKYLLPYDTLSPAEREKLFDEVETEWAKRESKTLQKVQQKVNKSDTASNASDSDSGDESEECIVKGRNMALNAFYRIARNTMSMWFKTVEPHPQEVEQEFWKHVTLRNNHICVHSGSIDSGSWGYGFAVTKNSPFARHAWNLKVLTNNSGSILRSMGPLMGVTVPTLHVGMVFSACCWYRDPHSLPWIEYLHTGANKIWYGIPDSMSEHFHKTLLKLVPNYCRNKSLWLPSDTVMIPPNLLVENGVSLCRTVQAPGQYIVVFPKVFTSSISTGYVVSESVYFAPPHWLQTGQKVFNELRNSCEPSMFSIDRLILSISSDPRSNIEVLKLIIPAVQVLCDRETKLREKLRQLGLSSTEKLPLPETPAVRKRKKLQDDNGDYECEICRTNLFISLVTESQDDAVYCLEHTIENLENEKIQIGYCKLLYTYDDGELGTLVEKIRSTIEFKQQKKIPGKYGNMPTLLK